MPDGGYRGWSIAHDGHAKMRATHRDADMNNPSDTSIPSTSRSIASAHIFCRVVDNFGDIGVCWRLARQLAHEYRLQVTLWVDDLVSFARLCPLVDVGCAFQVIVGVTVRHWEVKAEFVLSEPCADLVIEAFACDIPVAYQQAMSVLARPPVWINLEYLTAEDWIDDCHGMASRHPRLPLVKYFYFPGFSERSGGLIAESDLGVRRDAFEHDPAARSSFLSELGVQLPSQSALLAQRWISLFCYPQAPVRAWLTCLETDARETVVWVPQGVAREALAAWAGEASDSVPSSGRCRVYARGRVTVLEFPFGDQEFFDRLLWACDLNFVRGEDSFLRAQWARRPFVWHIYPQDDDAHWVKLTAFLAKFMKNVDAEVAHATAQWFAAWNGRGDVAAAWQAYSAVLPVLQSHARLWAAKCLADCDLAAKLMRFATKIG